jgi:DNA-directed RNA polymerase subunit RPC12/RpoP
MIEFSCIYCGRPIRIGADLIRQRIKCPACGHPVLVCEKKPEDASGPAPEEEARKAKAADFWAAKSDQEIAESLLLPAEVLTEQQRQRRAEQQLFSFLVPRYDDLTLFALGLLFVLLWLVNPDLQQDLIGLFTSPWSRGQVMVFLVVVTAAAAVGLALSLVNVFLRREKSAPEKYAMLAFAITVTAGTGLYAGGRLLNHSEGWLLVFPAWNILNACLLILSSLTIVDTSCITDEPASLPQLVITAICVPVLLAVCQSFELHWATTYSIAVAYTMSLHNGIRDVFGVRKPAPRMIPDP